MPHHNAAMKPAKQIAVSHSQGDEGHGRWPSVTWRENGGLDAYIGCRAVAIEDMITGVDSDAICEVHDGLLMVAGSKGCIALCLRVCNMGLS